jgi:hypothetical protein
LSPFLNRGITWAIFQSDGNTFSRKDLLNKLHNGFDISSFTDTNILLLIISGPTALLALRVHNISITSCSVTITWDRIFSHLSCLKMGTNLYRLTIDLFLYFLASLYKSAFTQTVSNALLISANVTLVTCFASNWTYSTLRNMINTDLNHLKKWSNRWLLKFNTVAAEYNP